MWTHGLSGVSSPQGQGGVHGGASRPRHTNLSEAAMAQDLQECMDMILRGHDLEEIDRDGCTALHWVCWFKIDVLLPRLLERKAKVDATNYDGETPLHYAAKSSNLMALDVLSRGDRSLLSQRDCDGFTPMILAAQNDNPQMMEWLYMKGISIEEQDRWGRTPLHWVCYKGQRKGIQYLLSRAASVMHRDAEGTTALHWAALKNQMPTVDMLLEVGAVHMIDVPDTMGYTPMSFGKSRGNRYLALLFLKSQLCQAIWGRANVFKNNFADLYVLFMVFNIFVFAFCVAHDLAVFHPGYVLAWSLMMGSTLLLWVKNCNADAGCLRPRTILTQDQMIGKDPNASFDRHFPVASQKAFQDGLLLGVSDATAEGALTRMEIQQNKLNYSRLLLHQAQEKLFDKLYRNPEHNWGWKPFGAKPSDPFPNQLKTAGTGGTEVPQVKMEETPEGIQLDRASKALREREISASEELARARQQKCLREDGGEYLMLLEKGDMKSICVVCRAVRKMRSHHCKECGRCVDRLDHHCPWIDNCVGVGNQRSFYCFICMLFSTILFFYVCAGLYYYETVFPLAAQGTFMGLIKSIFVGNIGPEVRAFMTLVASVFNLVWLAFVGALVFRHTLYMMMNITTFEVLVRPIHMVRRFPRFKSRLWFMKGFGFLSCLGRCHSYWTLDMERDEDDFAAPPRKQREEKDSMELSGEHGWEEGSNGSTTNRGETKSSRRKGSAAYHLVDNMV